MGPRSVSLFAMISFGVLIHAQGFPWSTHKRLASRSASPTYDLEDLYRGRDFFSKWTFFTGADPTHGNVNYLSSQAAQSQGLAYVDGDVTYLAVDSKSKVPVGGKRNSIRITSQKSYTGGLFILDAAHMPVGCGTWPSFWTFGTPWPSKGEIDIVEGVNSQTYNQMTLHTGPKHTCRVGPASGDAMSGDATSSQPPCKSTTPCNNTTSNEPSFTGSVLTPNCNVTATNNKGCGIQDHDSASFGPGFNGADGGVFALLWDPASKISVWHFARADIPQDITDKRPTPANWGTPAAAWGTATCDIASNFQDHRMVIDTTICGDWAGVQSIYKKSGCPGTCAQMVANASNFANAKWVINYVAVYQ